MANDNEWMIASDEEWVPLRQAVLEVATAYAKFMCCPPELALPKALDAVFRRARFRITKSRATVWSVAIVEGGKIVSHNDQSEGDAPHWNVWWMHEHADNFSIDDWVAGEFQASRKETDDLPGGSCLVVGLELTRSGLPLIGGKETAVQLSGLATETKERRPRGRPKSSGGFIMSDQLLVERMNKLILDNPGTTPHFAAGQFASEAEGSASLEVKQKRLANRYRSQYNV